MPSRVASYVLVLMLSFAVHADYQDGLDAYQQGDYLTAMREWRAVTDGPATAVVPTIYVEAHYAVAMLYWQGEGVAVDFRQAREWLLKAAELGHADAQAKLGFLYTDGKGVARDYAQAFEWFSKAAKGGSVDGLYNLGIFYLYGWGVEADRTMAKQYLAAASALGDEAAEEALQGLLRDEPGQPVGGGLAADTQSREQGSLPQVESAAAASGDVGGRSAADTQSREQGSLLQDESWIRAQDPQRYTIQVIALSSLPRLEALVRGFEDAGPFAWFAVQKSSKPLYVLLQGSYPDAKSARAAGAHIPAAIQNQDELWIRRFDGVQGSLE
ncbi:MAG: SPOR domain-containing protein [Xanthomonadales bacterium]|nr:SPOR domain-containing protein [Xanthomonadales bacterium]